ncbi:hypothetical protein AAK943_13800 [Emergencia timonensis]|jgi:hypothetical protein|nr:hypothetical protein [Emergencia timonensis]
MEGEVKWNIAFQQGEDMEYPTAKCWGRWGYKPVKSALYFGIA